MPRVLVAGAAIALLVAVLWMAWPEGNDLLILKLPNNMQLEMVLIPAGEFMMGSPESEEGRDDDESPQHRVKISKPFYMGKYEVTQAQWKAVMGDNPSDFVGDNLPVDNVSWENCQEFCRKLSSITEREIRLPSEAEWEYACRAGTTTVYSFGDDAGSLGDYAWSIYNSGGQSHQVGGKLANSWGLHDTHGNVYELCEDIYHGSYARDQSVRVVRGGCWSNGPGGCRSAHRDWGMPDEGSYYVGFRIVSETRQSMNPDNVS